MLNIEENISLLPFNTFHIDVTARFFAKISSTAMVEEFIKKGTQYDSLMILGGGSNILFTDDVNGLVLKNNIQGIELIREDEDHYYLKVGAGENWHQFVLYTIKQGYAGLENLSLIPGNVGASPMQNIGAYGVEVKDLIVEVEGIDLNSGERLTFSNTDCDFGYRTSIFKTSLKNKVFISSVTYRLNKKPHFNTSYGAIQQELESMNVEQLSIAAISEAVCNIRRSKLPDPDVIGNAGSFFKNPVLPNTVVNQIKSEYPEAPVYAVNDHSSKLAAGWLIEKCGWKGFRKNDFGVHDKQSLVLVNHGNSSGKELYNLSEEILQSVKEKFGVQLEREVNII